MRQTSAGYDPFPAVRKVSCEVGFKFIDLHAKENATPSASGTAPNTSLAQTIDGIFEVSGKYTTLDKNLWVLDGTMEFPPESAQSAQVGWWSEEVSGAQSTFRAGTTLTYDFSADVSCVGFTVYYDNLVASYPTQLKISTYDANNELVTEQTFTGTGYAQFYELPSANFRKLVFTFMKSNVSHRRVRILEIEFGRKLTFGNNMLESVEIEYGADPICAAIPTRQLSFSFDNADQKYNLLNPEGVYEFLQDGQEITATLTIGEEEISMGKFYFTEAIAESGALTARITANDMVYMLQNSTYDGGADTQTTLSEALSLVLNGTGVTVSYAGSIGSRSVYLSIKPGTTKRDAVRLLCQAARATCWINRDGVLTVSELSVGAEQGSITGDELYSWSGVKVLERVDAVSLTVERLSGSKATYTSGSGANAVSVSNPCVSDGNAVAAWILAQKQRRRSYDVENRCDPAAEIGDTLRISDAFGVNALAAVSGISVEYNGGLKAKTKAVSA